jgi:hypothetical protein
VSAAVFLEHCSIVHHCTSRMIKESGLKIIPFDSLDEAAEHAVKVAV